jgi:hypothetical protein
MERIMNYELFSETTKKSTGAVRTGIFRLRVILAGLIVVLPASAGALHYNRASVDFATVEEFFSSGKEVKVWSDTAVGILGISFSYHTNGISWRYTADRAIPCTLSVSDTLRLMIQATYIRNADTPAADSLVIATGPGQFNYLRLNVSAFQHALVTTAMVTGPASDTAGKVLRYGIDSVYCTLRHKVYYTFDWGDHFRSIRKDSRFSDHSWCTAGQYALRISARCQENLTTDTMRTFGVTMAPAVIIGSPVPNAYTSGFFIREVGGAVRLMDFSRGTGTPSDSDIVFNINHGYPFIARRGLVSLGTVDSLPVALTGGCTGAYADTNAVCRAKKLAYDSLIGALHIVCPAVLRDTVMSMEVGEVCLAKTTEGHNAILIKAGEYVGGIDREYFYWGYQGDGCRVLSPLSTSARVAEPRRRLSPAAAGILIKHHGAALQLVLSRRLLSGSITVYACDGTAVQRQTLTTPEQAVRIPLNLPRGVYVVSVGMGNEVLRQLVHCY